MPELSAILVNYNTRQMTLNCLESLLNDLAGTDAEVIVVDNASTDGSAEAIGQAFPQATLIASERNLGFGGGNNLAMKQARGSYLLLINTDAFSKAGAISTLLKYMETHPDVAAAGPRLLNEDGSLQRSCWRFPSPGRSWLEALWISGLFSSKSNLGDYRRWPHDTECNVDWVIGACCIVRQSAYEAIGGFDERFFMYAEETDWQHRMKRAGWKIGFVPTAEVVHLGGASDVREQGSLNPHFFRSRDLYRRKHYGISGLVSARIADAVGLLLRLPCWTLWMLIRPKDRKWTAGKIKFGWRLLVRQVSDWSSAVSVA